MAGTAGGNGAGILIQVKQVPAGAVTPQGVQKSLASLSEGQVQALGDLIKKLHSQISARFAELQPKPTGVSLEFGIDAAAEGGIPFITKGSIGANFKVTVEWK